MPKDLVVAAEYDHGKWTPLAYIEADSSEYGLWCCVQRDFLAPPIVQRFRKTGELQHVYSGTEELPESLQNSLKEAFG